MILTQPVVHRIYNPWRRLAVLRAVDWRVAGRGTRWYATVQLSRTGAIADSGHGGRTTFHRPLHCISVSDTFTAIRRRRQAITPAPAAGTASCSVFTRPVPSSVILMHRRTHDSSSRKRRCQSLGTRLVSRSKFWSRSWRFVAIERHQLKVPQSWRFGVTATAFGTLRILTNYSTSGTISSFSILRRAWVAVFGGGGGQTTTLCNEPFRPISLLPCAEVSRLPSRAVINVRVAKTVWSLWAL